MEKMQLKQGLIGLLSVVLGFVLKAIYRPYAYHHELNDFGLADSGPSFFYVIGLSQLLQLRKYQNPRIIIFLVVIASLIYEIYQSRKQVLDIGDIVASLFGGMVAYFLTYSKNSN